MNQAFDLSNFTLAKGSHESFERGACAMELAAHLAGEPHSDHPQCVCPVIGMFVRNWNDNLPDDKRNELLKPFIPRLLNTRGDKALEERRSLMAADWLVRTHTPAWLRLAGLEASADALANLPEITSMAQVPSIRGPLDAARKDADAAWAAAGAAAGDAAWAAAWAAAWDAAWAAARDAAGDAAWAAAWAAARDAAGAAAGDAAWAAAWDAATQKLAPTVAELQASAAALIDRMINAEG